MYINRSPLPGRHKKSSHIRHTIPPECGFADDLSCRFCTMLKLLNIGVLQKINNMKNFLVTITLSLLSCILFAQDKTDEQAIKNQLTAMFTSWNNHNYDDMKNYTTDDVDWVNVVGMWWKGRKEVQFAHQETHKIMFKNTALEQKQTTIRFITPDVAIVHLVSYHGETTTPDGSKGGNTDDLATLVFLKKDGKWLITAGENVRVNEIAKPHDPILQMPKN